MLEQIIGGDISIFAAHLAAIHLALQEPLSYTDEIHIILGDFFSYSPKKTILDWINQSRTMKKVSAENIRDVEFRVPLSDLVIMNPPFTRMELLEKDYKKFVENSFEGSNKMQYLQGRMGLHALFLLHSDEFLKPNGEIAAVLPASTFYTGYGEKLEDFFLSKYNIKYIISSDIETTFSEQSTFKEILFIAQKKIDKSKSPDTLFVSLKVPLTLKNSKELANKIKKLKEVDFEDEDLRVKVASKSDLIKEKNWMTFTDQSSKLYKRIGNMQNVILSREFLEDKISEGIRRFPTDFFVFPNSFWNIIKDEKDALQIEHTNTKETLHISKKLLIHTIRKPELYDKVKVNPDHYLLIINPNEKIDRDLERYISLGEKLEQDKESSTLVKTTHREKVPWYSYTYLLRKNPKIFGNVFIIDKLRVNTGKLMAHYTPEKVTAGGSFHILSVDSDENAKILALWYNSMIHMFLFLYAGREIQGAYYRALISDLKKLPMIDVDKIDKKSRLKLLSLFDKYASTTFPTFPKQIEQGIKKELDLTLLEVLGEKDQEKTLKFIYQYLSDKIEKLRVETNR
ncbi:MAG: Eco57I restriction-modification methylase domain-containing protein [Candidatus Micrarchaeaceae archaeon]